MQARERSRRWFLRGLGGSTLAIPALTSLLSDRDAKAALAAQGRIFIGIMSHFGGVWSSNMFPALSPQAESMTYAGRKIRRAKIASASANGTTRVSEVLSATSSLLTPCVGRENVVVARD